MSQDSPSAFSSVGRRYIVGMAVDATGNGMYRPVSLLYFHFVTGMPLARVGLVLTTAALFGLVSNPLAGVIVDRAGAKASVVGGYIWRAAAFGAFPLVHDEWTMFGVLAVVAVGDGSYQPSIQSFVAATVTGAERDKLIALQRSLRNAGLGAGGLLASLALAVGSNQAFYFIVVGNAVSFLLAAALIWSIQSGSEVGSRPVAQPVGLAIPGSGHATVAVPAKGYRAVLHNHVFVALTVANVPIAFGYMVLSVVLPVFVTEYLKQPSSLAGALYALNTVGIAALQVPISRRLTRYRRTRVAMAGGMVFVASFLAFAGLYVGANRGLLLVGVFAATGVFTTGELLQGATTSALAASAAPPATRGRHLAFYQFSWALPTALAPAALTALLEVSPTLLWLVLAGGIGGSILSLRALEPHLPRQAVWPSAHHAASSVDPKVADKNGGSDASCIDKALPPAIEPSGPGRARQVVDRRRVQRVRL